MGVTSVPLQVLPNQFQKGMVGPCPDNAAVCNTLSCNESCTVGGTCVQGRCYCNLQYTGPECAKKLTPSGNYTTYVPVADDGASAFGAYDSGYLMVSRYWGWDERLGLRGPLLGVLLAAAITLAPTACRSVQPLQSTAIQASHAGVGSACSGCNPGVCLTTSCVSQLLGVGAACAAPAADVCAPC